MGLELESAAVGDEGPIFAAFAMTASSLSVVLNALAASAQGENLIMADDKRRLDRQPSKERI
tara:strand:+ start:787 stop:972 length:186 start_codon:yes stop_codon:yes gene_type:complete